MDDIAPGLLEELRRLFLELLGEEPLTAEDWPSAYAAAEKVGGALARAFGQGLYGDILPDGRMYWNIADRVVRPLLEEEYMLAARAAQAAQQALNTAAGLGLRAAAAPVDSERIEGILNRLAAEEQYEDVSWLLDEPVRLLARSAVDETVHRNVEFQAKAGLRPRVVRTAEPGACKWCRALTGSYDYPDLPKDVYRRHENCRCRVEFDPRDGKRQDVWGKQWTQRQDSGILEERKTFDPFSNSMRLYGNDIEIGRSVGAKAKNYDVMDLITGEIYHFVEGSRIQNVEVFAGKGVRTPFRDAEKYAERYGGTSENWQHVKGIGEIETSDGDRKVEIHWVQCQGIGKYEFFIKEWLD